MGLGLRVKGFELRVLGFTSFAFIAAFLEAKEARVADLSVSNSVASLGSNCFRPSRRDKGSSLVTVGVRPSALGLRVTD